MININNITLQGRLVREPTVRSGNGSSMAFFTLASNYRYHDQGNALHEEVAFVPCKVFGKWTAWEGGGCPGAVSAFQPLAGRVAGVGRTRTRLRLHSRQEKQVVLDSTTSGLFGLRATNQPFYPLSVPESMTRFHIRSGREQDCSEVARLASQLGYPVSGETMRTRLQSLLASPGNVVLYGSLGYTQAKTQMVFRKSLSFQSKPAPEPKRI